MASWTRPALAALTFVATLEVGARLVIALQVGRSVPGAVAPDVRVATGTPIAEQTNALAATGQQVGERIHPFVGYLPDMPQVPTEGPVTLAFQREAHAPSSPLFSTDPDDLVIGIAGGSVAYQFATNGGAQALSEALLRQPKYAGRRPRCVALAAVGLKQPQHALWYVYLLTLGARLDLVISLDGFNEIAMHESENEPYGISPAYPRYWLQRMSPADAAPLVGERIHLVAGRAGLVRRFLSSPLRHSGVSQLVWLLRDQAARRAVADVDARLQAQRAYSDLDFVTQGPVLAGSTLGERLAFQARIWRGAQLQMHHAARANGARSYHFLQPNQYDPDSKPLSARERARSFSEGHRYGRLVPEGYGLLRQAAEELTREGVRFHDLSRVFEDVQADIYVDDCCHVNRAGNLLLAQAIADAIASWGDE